LGCPEKQDLLVERESQDNQVETELMEYLE
jgi:hypothetical protein